MPVVETYSSVYVFFCPDSVANSTFNVGFYVQDADGGGYP